MLQHEVVEVEHFAELGGEALALEQVGHAHRAPRDLVLVRRADAATRRADRVRATRLLARAIERDVRRQDQRAVGLMRRRSNTGTPCRSSRLASRSSASSDSTTPLPMKHSTPSRRMPGRDQRQHGLLAVDDERVAGVVTALEAHHRGDALGQQVDDLALAFVAPLGADDDEVATHDSRMRSAALLSAAHTR